jgi:imidazolonepropionase-like amidohydrolase
MAETVLPGVIDRHVHLGLVDDTRLANSPVVEVHDLGWSPCQQLEWRRTPPDGLIVKAAGPFHTAPGGYPTGRPWAPRDSVRPVASPAAARAAVDEAIEHAYDALKVTLHTGMPMLADDTLGALVEAAHAVGLTVIAHVEGPGQAARAIDAGVDALAHVPWTERVPDDVLRRGRHTTWISTLAIHGPADQSVAIDNIRRFREAGGTVAYGTDMGNGPAPAGAPAGVSTREIQLLEAAGLSGDDLLRAVLGPLDDQRPGRTLVSPLSHPASAAELVAWLTAARRTSEESS